MPNKAKSYIAIPSILKVEAGVLDHIGDFLKNADLKKVVIFFGNGLIDMFGSRVMESLRVAGVEVLEYQELDTVCLPADYFIVRAREKKD